MTPDEHAAHHADLHASLDELAADFMTQHTDKRLGNTTIMELLTWSHAQTIKPTDS